MDEFFTIRFVVEFEQACALAEILHRLRWEHLREHAINDAQALRAWEALDAVLQGLIARGFDPRDN